MIKRKVDRDDELRVAQTCVIRMQLALSEIVKAMEEVDEAERVNMTRAELGQKIFRAMDVVTNARMTVYSMTDKVVSDFPSLKMNSTLIELRKRFDGAADRVDQTLKEKIAAGDFDAALKAQSIH